MVKTNEISVLQRISWLFNVIFHQIVAVLTVFILWIVFKHYELNENFTWHIILCTIAYVPLMAEAVILFWGDNLWSQNIDRTKKYWIHGTVLLLSAVSVTVGISLLIQAEPPGAKHFSTNHGLTGLISWILVLLSVILGFISANAQKLKFIMRPVFFKFIHNLLGIAGYVIGAVSLGYGINYGILGQFSSKDAERAAIWCLGIAVFWSLIAALKSCYNQIKDIFSSS